MLGTVTKAGRVLDLFTCAHPEWGVTEVAKALEIPKSSAHSLLTTLADTGLLQRTDDNRYKLGWRVLTLSRTLLDSSDVRVHAQRAIRTLVERFGTTVHLATLDDGEVTYLDKAEGVHVFHIPLSGVGRRVPPHCSALGKVLLAYQPWAIAEQILHDNGLVRYTANTICSIDELRLELSVVRHQGYARDNEEIVGGLCCYGAPIFDVHGRIEAAISVAITAEEDRAHRDRYRRLAMAAGTQVTRNLRSAGSDWLIGAAGQPDAEVAATV
jgi:IclR family KDG regulon transcriptional repressor